MKKSVAAGQAAWAGASPRPASMQRRQYGLTNLLELIATWDDRMRLRWDLEQRSKDAPHLIDDIGLTEDEVKAEISKPFWRA